MWRRKGRSGEASPDAAAADSGGGLRALAAAPDSGEVALNPPPAPRGRPPVTDTQGHKALPPGPALGNSPASSPPRSPAQAPVPLGTDSADNLVGLSVDSFETPKSLKSFMDGGPHGVSTSLSPGGDSHADSWQLAEVEAEDADRRSASRSKSINDLGWLWGSQGTDMSGFSAEWPSMQEEVGPKVEINRPGIVPLAITTCLWVVASVVILAGIIWVYFMKEVESKELAAAKAALALAEARATRALSPGPAAARALDLAFRSGAIAGLSDYQALRRVLAPYLSGGSALREVQLAGEVDGAVLLRSAPRLAGGVELRTDRDDCAEVPGDRSCALRPMRANASTWYGRGTELRSHHWYALQLQPAWDGPSFTNIALNEATCEELCWAGAYSFVARVAAAVVDDSAGASAGAAADSGGNASNATVRPPHPTLLVRASLATDALQAVAKAASDLVRGEAFLCTAGGSVIGASDMADSVYIDTSTGAISPARVWQLARDWASGISENFVRDAPYEQLLSLGEARLSAWRVQASNATPGLHQELRLVVAIPTEAFADSVLGPLRTLMTGVGITPPAVVALYSLLAALPLLCRCTKKASAEPNDEQRL